MRVFISSTVYDLLDVRAEIADLLRSLGISPVLSDDKLSDFVVQFDANSIETCLINVESCDEVIVVLDKRYGPSLGNAGFDDVSATHLEYRHAVEHKKPIHFYVRDRLAADHSVWKKNEHKSGVEFTWVDENGQALFPFIDEHRKLASDSKRSNWYATFTSSTDLKASLRAHFERLVRPERLVDAICENRFPLFDVKLDVEHEVIDGHRALQGTANITNIGGSAAFNFNISWEDKADEAVTQAIIAPGQSTILTFMYPLYPDAMSTTGYVILQYETPMGVAVSDRFKVHAGVRPGPQQYIISGAQLLKRQFTHSKNVLVEIEDA